MGTEQQIERLWWVKSGTAEVLGALQQVQGENGIRDAEVCQLAENGRNGFTGRSGRGHEDLLKQCILLSTQGGTLFRKQLWVGREIVWERVARLPIRRAVFGGEAVDQFRQVENIAVQQWISQLSGKKHTEVSRGVAERFQCLLLVLGGEYEGQLRVEPVECGLHFFAQNFQKQRVTADVEMPAAPSVIGLGVCKHFILDAEDIAGVVDEDGSGAGGPEWGGVFRRQ